MLQISESGNKSKPNAKLEQIVWEIERDLLDTDLG